MLPLDMGRYVPFTGGSLVAVGTIPRRSQVTAVTATDCHKYISKYKTN
jgi:hypothetical protein